MAQGCKLSNLPDARRAIHPIDTHQPFLEKLKQRAQAEGLSDKITAVNMSMFALDFEAKSFDAIWSEGAIYIMGF